MRACWAKAAALGKAVASQGARLAGPRSKAVFRNPRGPEGARKPPNWLYTMRTGRWSPIDAKWHFIKEVEPCMDHPKRGRSTDLFNQWKTTSL